LPKHPDFTGEATIDGQKFKLAGWTKSGKRGDFYSLAFTQEQPATEQPAEQAQPGPASEEDSIPF
jgi:hypothetical protein